MNMRLCMCLKEVGVSIRVIVIFSVSEGMWGILYNGVYFRAGITHYIAVWYNCNGGCRPRDIVTPSIAFGCVVIGY